MTITQISLKQEYNNLGASEEPVIDGYGEYLVYGGDIDLTEKTFADIYKIFNFYGHNPEIKIQGSLSELISSEVKAINDHLKVVFIPRILHDLIYIVAAIKEEETETCVMQSESTYRWMKQIKQIEKFKNKYDECWHLVCSTDRNPVSNDDPDLIHLAYRFNQYCCEELQPQGYFKGREIVDFVETKINFLKNHRTTFEDVYTSKSYMAHQNLTSSSSGAGVAADFGLPNNRYGSFEMGIKNEDKAQIVRKAVALECSTVAENALVLYRAGKYSDSCFNSESVKKKSFSYGTSLFAGCVRDGTACVFHYTIGQQRDTYAVVVPRHQYSKSPFHVPQSSALVQLLAVGELFHSHSRIISDGLESFENDLSEDCYHVSGFFEGLPASKLEELKTDMTPEELSAALNECHKYAYFVTDESEDEYSSSETEDGYES